MNLFKLDLFSSEFYFSLGGQQYRKGTVQGIFLSFFAAATVISYFVYLLNQLVNNQIDPKFRSQSFLVNDRIEVSMNEDILGFLFNYNQTFTMDQLEQAQNKTYLVYYAQFSYGDHENSRLYNLDVVHCTNSKLKSYRCIDFSKISNETLVLDNSKSIYSQIQIYVYGCNDLDSIKTTIPDNCAAQNEIDDAINGAYGFIQLKLQVQQYNTTSKQMQTDYRRINTFLLSNQFIMNNIHAQKQETEVSTGLIFQSQQTYSSPIQYDSQTSTYDRQSSLDSGLGPYNQISISMDEIVQQFQIQFPTLTEILALLNSVAAIVMVARVLGKLCSQKLICQDLFMLILRNLFQEKNEQILKHNKFIDSNNDMFIYQQNSSQDNQDENHEHETQEKQIVNNIFVPSFQTKFRDFVETSQMVSSNNDYQYTIQKSIETEEDQKDSKEIQIPNTFILKQPHKRNSNQQKQLENKHKFKLFRKDSIPEKDNLSQTPKSNYDEEKSTISKSGEILKQSQFYKSDFIIDSQANDKVQETIGNKRINSHSITQKLKAINSSSLNKSIQNFIFKFKRKEFEISKGIDSNSIKGIGKEASKHLDIFNLYKDILFLKKAIMMLLRRDQLAAIQLVGLTDDYLNIDLRSESSKKDFDQKKTLSHFESQFLILQSEQLQAEYIERFLNKCKNGQDINEVDARIISSMFKKK